jgi:hypothetical protein
MLLLTRRFALVTGLLLAVLFPTEVSAQSAACRAACDRNFGDHPGRFQNCLNQCPRVDRPVQKRPATAAGPPTMASKWARTTLPARECIQMAERAVRSLGFKEIDITQDSPTDRGVFGERGRHFALVNCVEEREIVYIVVAGPDGSDDECERLAKAILSKF